MLFIIDMQNDFLDQKRGKMSVKDADILVPRVLEKIEQYEAKEDKIFYTLNIHEDMKDDNRSNEEKKWGQSIYPLLKEKLEKHTPLKKIYYGITPEKASWIKEEYKDKKDYVEKIEIVGVETHICVLSNAIVIQNMFPDSKIIIDSSLCTSNDLKLHQSAIEIMRGLKMEIL